MQDHGSIGKLRECFNESTFFSTEVSSPSRSLLINQDSLRLAKMPSKFTDDPQLYLRKIKIKKKEVNQKCLEALRNTVKAKVDLERVQRDASVSRYDFMRLYNVKKFRLDEQALISSYRADHEFNFRLSLERTKRSRVLNELSLSARKEQQSRNIEHLFETNKLTKSVFRETLRASQEKAKEYAEESAERVKKERFNFHIRKKNLTELNTTKSKLNYLSKINEQMQAIKEYQQMVQVAEKDPEYMQELGRSDLTERKKEDKGKTPRFSSTYAGGFY